MPRRAAKTHFLKDTNLAAVIEPPKSASDVWGTKVIATIGPSCRDVDTLARMLRAGRDHGPSRPTRGSLSNILQFRKNLEVLYVQGGSIEYHKESLRNLATAVKQERRLCAVMLDTVGRELIIRRDYTLDEQGWPRYKEPTDIKAGQEVVLTGDPDADISDSRRLAVSYSKFASMCQRGDQLFVGRYLVNGADVSSLYLEVKNVQGSDVTCIAQNDAQLDGLLTLIHQERSEDAGMSSYQAELPMLTSYDIRAIEEISSEFEVDFLALTYTCAGEDIASLRAFLHEHDLETVKIVAKVENRQALENFADIVGSADGVILSRGNLGLDVASEKMAMVQKVAIDTCNRLGRPVIITRVVDTMVSAPRCTRAEATDVANAVLDGADGILLGAETLRGSYPVQTIQTVLSICRSAEAVFDHGLHFETLMSGALESELEDVGGEHASGAAGPSAFEMEMDTVAGLRPGKQEEKGGARSASDTLPAPVNIRSSSIRPTNSMDGPGTPRSPQPGSARGGMTKPPSFGTIPRLGSGTAAAKGASKLAPRLSAQESMASTAVRAAAKIKAGLIIVYASSGRTASLIAKYRPNQPILVLVVPQLKTNTLKWTLHGRSLARQCLLIRGLAPMLAAPMQGRSDAMLGQAIAAATHRGLVEPHQHVVCVEYVKDVLTLKIISVDALGQGISSRDSRKGSAMNLEKMQNGEPDSPVSEGSLHQNGSLSSPFQKGGIAAQKILPKHVE